MPPTFEEIRTHAAAWLEPVPGPAPAGAPALYDPQYQLVLEEVGKLDSATGGKVDWGSVRSRAGEILQAKSKDLLLAAYLAHALHVTDGADGLAAGAALVAEMLERYWEGVEPRRLRGRAGAVEWFLEKTCGALDGRRPGWSVAQLEGIEVATQRLEEVARARLGDDTPAFGDLRAWLARVRRETAPMPAANEPAPPAEAPAPDVAPTPQATGQAATVPAAIAAEVPAFAGADATEFLRRVGDALIEVARALRQASTADPTAFRVLRTGLWIHLSSPPPATAGRTTIAPPPQALSDKLALLAQHEQWLPLVEEVESALPRQRFALDLHRTAWQALDALGAAHARSRDAIALELRVLLARMPSLPALAFADGTPLASAPTRAWIEEVVSPRGAGGAPRDPSARPEAAARLPELLQGLAGGNTAEALARVQGAILAAASGRDRFILRLELARACAAAGLQAIAKGIFEDLAEDASAHGLDAWEPQLSAGALRGLIAAARALGNDDDPRAATPQLAEHFRRLCRIDPAAAHEVWP